MNPEISLTDRAVDRLAKNETMAELAGVVQPVVQQIMTALGKPTTDLLHGTPLGHPLHPAIVDVPVGAWSTLFVFDLIELARGPENVAGAADTALLFGIASGLAAASSGWADWSDTKDEPRTLGMLHAVLNGAAVLVYGASFGLRKAGARKTGIALSMLAYGVAGAASYLGGELSLGYNLGAKHAAIPIDPPQGYVVVMPEADLAPETLTRVDFGGIPVLLRRTVDRIDAVGAVCTHRGAPLDEGALEGDCVRCPWHGALYRLADGSVLEGPASFPLPRFTARITNGNVEVAAAS
jgi:nitrite reductase/ring-hydroxylating ferredoxin subunit/uncharacterized membrane protein